MTSTPLKNVNSLMNYVSVGHNGNMAGNLTENFTAAFSKATGQSEVQNIPLHNDKAVQSTQVKVNKQDLNTTDSAKDISQVDKSNVNTKAKDEVQKAGEEMVKQVAEELGMTEDEVRKAMEALGLTIVDLFQPDNMTALVLTLSGEDMLSLMTDEGLYNSLQNLLSMANETVSVIQENLGITPEEMTAILEKLKTEKQIMPEDTVKNPVDLEKPEMLAGQQDYAVTVEKDGEVVKVDVKVDGNSQTESSQVTTEKAREPETGKENSSKKDSSSSEGNAQSNVVLDHILNKATDVNANVKFEDTMPGNTASTQDIMNQIMDYMKIQVKADLTQMEIQLHPASLGTVNINISSKEGVISAQILTQNEVVKAAVESQIVQLKNNFEEQGLKVEAVEVTVESHRFERGLSGEGNNQDGTGEGNKKKGTRKINLDDLNLEEVDLEEEEQIAVEMMTAGGNTVDYMA